MTALRPHDDPLGPYVPLLATELAATTSGPAHRRVDGSLLSADISGFTALTERLAAEGRIGAERLTTLINGGFEAMIGIAYRYGAEVLKFGGDALLMLFRGADHARRAAAAAAGMHDALRNSAAAGETELAMTVGIGAGPFDVFLVGSITRELLITGSEASAVIALEAAAQSGETVVDRATADACGTATGEERGDGLVLLEAPSAVEDGPANRGAMPDGLDEFVPVGVSSQLAAVNDTGGEHRLGSIVFVAIDGVVDAIASDGDDAVTDALHAVVDAIHTIGTDTGVAVLHSDIAPDGAKFLLCAGAPVSSGHDEDSALTAATLIAAIPTPLRLRCGSARGRLFATFLGTTYRRTYTLMGDSVNTAARMLGPAGPGEVIATDGLVRSTRTGFLTEPLEPVLVKGKRDPIAIHHVVAPEHGARIARFSSPVVGRDAELERLRDVASTPGGVIHLVGPAGSGKSRLITELHNHAYVRGLTVFEGSCTPLGSATPYGVFRSMLREGLGIARDANPADAGELLAKVVVDEAPRMQPWLPLIATVLGASVEPTPESDAVEADFRRDRVHDAIVELLDEVMFDDPLLFVIEDAQWIDEASRTLFDRILSASSAGRNWSACVTSRRDDAVDLDQHDTAVVLPLAPLADDAIRAIAVVASPAALTDHDLDRIVERSGGSAMFAEELARVGPEDGTALPETIEQVIIDRIDRLDPEVRAAVRSASVFGTRARLADLDAVVGSTWHDDDLVERSGGLLASPAPGEVEFVNTLHREAAYAGLPFGERTRLHRLLGDRLEAAADDPMSIADVLAWHFSAGRDRPRTWTYALAAARSATNEFAWFDAISRYRLAIDAADDAAARGRAWAELGECGIRSGTYVDAEHAFATSVELAEDDAQRCGRRIRQAVACTRQAAYERALALLDLATQDASADAGLQAEVLAARATVAYQQADNAGAHGAASRALELGGDDLDVRSRARVHMILHITAETLGIDDAAHHGSEALRLHRVAGDLSGEAEVLNNLGVSAFYRSDRAAAESFYRECLELKERCGDVAGASMARLNLAELLVERGRPGDADDLLVRCRRNFEATGLVIGLCFCAVLEGRLRMLEDDPDGAVARMREAADGYRALGAHGRALEAGVHEAEALLLAGDLDDASELVDALHPEFESSPEQFDEGADRGRARLAILRGAIALKRSGFGAARPDWEQAASIATAAGADDLRLTAELLAAPSPRRRRVLRRELAALGVDRVPILDHLGVLDQGEDSQAR